MAFTIALVLILLVVAEKLQVWLVERKVGKPPSFDDIDFEEIRRKAAEARERQANAV